MASTTLLSFIFSWT